MPSKNTLSQRFSTWMGRKFATMRKGVTIPKSALVSPEARIAARTGKIILGEGCMICPHAVLQGNITVGEGCSVQPYSILVGYGTAEDTEGEIRIGNHVRIASHVMIIGANHVFEDPDIPICDQGLDRKTIVIEDDVWIAGKASIMAGVHIGKGSDVAAGAVVTKDVAPYSVVAGVPAKVIKTRKKNGENKL